MKGTHLETASFESRPLYFPLFSPLFRLRHVPQLDRFVLTPGGQRLAVRAERHLPHLPCQKRSQATECLSWRKWGRGKDLRPAVILRAGFEVSLEAGNGK